MFLVFIANGQIPHRQRDREAAVIRPDDKRTETSTRRKNEWWWNECIMHMKNGTGNSSNSSERRGKNYDNYVAFSRDTFCFGPCCKCTCVEYVVCVRAYCLAQILLRALLCLTRALNIQRVNVCLCVCVCVRSHCLAHLSASRCDLISWPGYNVYFAVGILLSNWLLCVLFAAHSSK